jgi:peptide/nickel transport system permease protein
MGSHYFGRKILHAAVTLVFVVLVNFLLFRMMPGSPERILLHNAKLLPPDAVAQLQARWGLDRPLFPDQLIAYIGSTLQLDFGPSFKYGGLGALDVVLERVWPTVLLLGLGELIAIVVGLALGAIAGWRRGRLSDHVATTFSLVAYSMPYFWPGMIAIIIFSTALGWFPSFGMSTAGLDYASPIDAIVDYGSHLILPVTVLSIGLIGEFSLLMRSSLIEVLAEDYVQTARAKGLSEDRILRSHAIPNALLPTVTLISISLGYILAGAITLEVVFSWPGLGTLTVEALGARDYNVLQVIFLLLSVSVILANLISDVIYGFLDPRVKT